MIKLGLGIDDDEDEEENQEEKLLHHSKALMKMWRSWKKWIKHPYVGTCLTFESRIQ